MTNVTSALLATRRRGGNAIIVAPIEAAKKGR